MGHHSKNLNLLQAALADLSFHLLWTLVVLNPGCSLESLEELLENASAQASQPESLIGPEPMPLVALGSSPYRCYLKRLQMILRGSQDWEPLSGGKNVGSGVRIDCTINSCVSLGKSFL